MNIEVNLTAVAVFASICAVLIALATYWRAGDWRRSDSWRSHETKVVSIDGRVGQLEAKMAELPNAVRGIGDRLTRLEAHIDALPSKAEMVGLAATVVAVKDEVDTVREGVIRIEQFLMEHKS